MERPPGIYASSLSRRDLARRRARMRPPLMLRADSYAVAGALVALVGVVAERLVA
jgi:hypothetical protein